MSTEWMNELNNRAREGAAYIAKPALLGWQHQLPLGITE